MNLLDYNLKQLRKTYNKKHENYIVSRIFHGINSNTDDIQMITQQYVKRPNGCALTDLYFPQFKMHLEIDEPHHSTEKNRILDLNRELEVVEASGHEIKHIEITENKSLQVLNNEIDEFVNHILELREKISFNPWKLEEEYTNVVNFNKYHEKGLIRATDNVRFRKISDAANCLGQNVNGMQKAFFRSKKYTGKCLWFPKLYKNNDWDNKLVEDVDFLKFHNLDYGDLIQEKPVNKEFIEKHVVGLKNEKTERIVFPRFIDNLGYIIYKFMGIYRVDENLSTVENGMIYKRISHELDLI